jgi:hypothetical protein
MRVNKRDVAEVAINAGGQLQAQHVRANHVLEPYSATPNYHDVLAVDASASPAEH